MESLISRMQRLTQSVHVGLAVFSVAVIGTVLSLLPCSPAAIGATGSGGFTAVAGSLTDSSARLTMNVSQTKFVQGSDGKVYLTVDLTAPEMPTVATRAPVDMVVVLDRSGSMADANKLPLAKSAIEDLTRRLNAEDRLAIITFDNSAIVQLPLVPVTDAQRAQISRSVQSIYPGGGTNIGDGLTAAYSLLRGSSSAGRTRKIMLLSDGQANVGISDSSGLNGIAGRAKGEEVVLSTIGMGLGFNEVLMSSMADYGMGTYGYLEHLGKLHEILARNLEDARNVYARASELRMNIGSGVSVIDAAGYPLNRISSTEVAIPLGQVLSGSTKHVMVTFAVPTGDIREFDLGSLTAVLSRDSGEERLETSGGGIRIAVLAPEHREQAVASINSDVWKKAWTENNLGRMRQDVADALRKGDQDGARRSYDEYKTELKAKESEAGVAFNSPVLDGELNEIDRSVKDAFSGSPAQQAERQNSYGKALHRKGIEEQRAN